MIRFRCDEDIDGRVLRGLIRRYPEIDITSINELGMKGAADPDVLRIAIEQDRVLLTHDVRTMRPWLDNSLSQHRHPRSDLHPQKRPNWKDIG